MAWPMAHILLLSNEHIDHVGLDPCARGETRAPMMPPAIVMAPIESPNPGPGGPTMWPYSGRVRATSMPAASPERQAVVGSFVGVRAPFALTGTSHIDDVRDCGRGFPRH